MPELSAYPETTILSEIGLGLLTPLRIPTDTIRITKYTTHFMSKMTPKTRAYEYQKMLALTVGAVASSAAYFSFMFFGEPETRRVLGDLFLISNTLDLGVNVYNEFMKTYKSFRN
jgi:hypothetical protein